MKKNQFNANHGILQQIIFIMVMAITRAKEFAEVLKMERYVSFES